MNRHVKNNIWLPARRRYYVVAHKFAVLKRFVAVCWWLARNPRRWRWIEGYIFSDGRKTRAALERAKRCRGRAA